MRIPVRTAIAPAKSRGDRSEQQKRRDYANALQDRIRKLYRLHSEGYSFEDAQQILDSGRATGNEG